MKADNMKTTRYITIFLIYASIFFSLSVLQNAWIAILIYHLLALIFVARYEKNFLHKKVAGSWLLLVSFIGIIFLGIGLYILYPLLFEINLISDVFSRFHLGAIPLFLLYFSIINPAVEELFWRHGTWKDNGRTDILFAFYHIIVLHFFLPLWITTIAFVGLILIARIWRWHHNHYKSLFVIYLSHAMVDFGLFGSVYLLYLYYL